MRAAYIMQTGPPEVIIYGDLPTPTLGPKQYLVKIAAVDVNPIDVYIRSGMVPANVTFPFILGRDLAGIVVETAPGTTRFKRGDRVWATNQGFGGRPGTFAEYAAVDEEWLYPIPDNISFEEAAAVSLVGVTAHLGLVQKAKAQQADVVFVNGGAGGVGSCVVQMAKALGARVIATAGNQAKIEACKRLGADLVLNYNTDDLVAAVKSYAPQGVNIWWETSRQPDFDRAISMLAFGGRMIVMAGRDARPTFPVGQFYVKDCTLIGFAMFNASADQMRSAANQINEWLASGKLKPRIDRILPLSEVAFAHRLQEESTVKNTGTVSGKIVLKVET